MALAPHRPDIVTDGGPWADHDMACAVYSQSEKAVIDIHTGKFHPSWRAHGEGWRLVKARTKLQRAVLWLFGFYD